MLKLGPDKNKLLFLSFIFGFSVLLLQHSYLVSPISGTISAIFIQAQPGTYGIADNGACYYSDWDGYFTDEYSSDVNFNQTFEINLDRPMYENCKVARKLYSERDNSSFDKNEFLESQEEYNVLFGNYALDYSRLLIVSLIFTGLLILSILSRKYLVIKAESFNKNYLNKLQESPEAVRKNDLKRLLEFNKEIIEGHYRKALKAYWSLRNSDKDENQ